MDAQRWRRVRELFEALSDLPAEQWAPRLDAACADDAELRAEALALLHADQEAKAAGTGLAACAPALVDAAAQDYERQAARELAGQRVGPFRLRRELGRGGMGQVWLAERDDGQFAQQVAVKLLRSGWDVDELLARFRAERQILAGLQHPNIAHLIDGGVTADGKPWLALEYVDGVNLCDHCDARRLPLAARLRLFRTVCDAVAYAHGHLVVHRDLKPSNLLVAADGSVKLLDFGIAKLIDSNAPNTAARLFTLDYAAPEQIRGDVVTTAVDVYALGLLLYELLTGQRPYAADGDSATARERAVLEQAPTRPSAAVLQAEDEAMRRAAARQCTPPQLARALRGDLDAVVLKALRKEPEQRYASVADLSADVARYVEHRPVLARRGGWRYQAGRFLRRHALAVGLVALAACGLVGGAALALWQAQRARHEAVKADATRDFMVGLFEGSSVARVGGREVKAADLLDAALARVRADVDEPEARSDLLLAIIAAYRNLRLGGDTLAIAEEALAVARRLDDPLRLARTLLLHAAAMHDEGRHEQVLRDVAEAEALLPDTDDDAAMDTLRTRLIQARSNAYLSLDRPREALQALDELYALQQRRLGMLAPLTMNTLIYRAAALYNLDEVEREAALLQPTIDALRASPQSDQAYLAPLCDMLAMSLVDADPDRAVALQREALQRTEAAEGPDSSETAHRASNFAITLTQLGRYAEAMALDERALRIERAQKDMPFIAFKTLRNLALTHLLQGQAAQAEPLLGEAIALRERPESERDTLLAHAYFLRALARQSLQRGEAAASDVARGQALFGSAHPAAADSLDVWQARALVAVLPGQPAGDCTSAAALRRLANGHAFARAQVAALGDALLAACAWQREPGAQAAAGYATAMAALRPRLDPRDVRLAVLDAFERRQRADAAHAD